MPPFRKRISPSNKIGNRKKNSYIGLSPLPVTVTTRIVTFLVGNPNLNLHLPQASLEGGQPNSYRAKLQNAEVNLIGSSLPPLPKIMRTSYAKLQLQKRTQLSIPFHSLHIETKLPIPIKKGLATSKDEIHWPSKSLGTILEAHSAPPNRPKHPKQTNKQTNHHHPLRENFFPAGPSQIFFWGASDIKKSGIVFSNF